MHSNSIGMPRSKGGVSIVVGSSLQNSGKAAEGGGDEVAGVAEKQVLTGDTLFPGSCGRISRWRDCHFVDALSPSLLIHPLKVEGGAAG